jgi:hypothetical protein
MELAAIIATALVVVLQIITIALVVGNRKNVRDQVGKASPALSNDKSEDRKERDFRIQNRRPAQDQRPKPPTQQPVNTGSVETVEKSLRDINLKLKNAERDQEFARRKVQENFPKDSNRRPNGNDRNIGNEIPSSNERGNGSDRNSRGSRDSRDRDSRDRDSRDRDSRDRDGRESRDRDGRDRDTRHSGHDRSRGRGGNWQERNKTRESISFGPAPQNDENQVPLLAQDQVKSQESVVAQTPIAAITDNSPDLVPVDLGSDDSLQHGRKILVKRRMLKEDEGQQSEGGDETNSSSGDSPANITSESSINMSNSDNSESTDSNDGTEKSSDGAIRFGRR